MSRLDEILTRLHAALPQFREEHGVRSFAVFGSVARGTARPDSDIDILVEFEPDAHPTLLTLAGLQLQVEGLLQANVDLVLGRALRAGLRDGVNREAIRVA